MSKPLTCEDVGCECATQSKAVDETHCYRVQLVVEGEFWKAAPVLPRGVPLWSEAVYSRTDTRALAYALRKMADELMNAPGADTSGWTVRT